MQISIQEILNRRIEASKNNTLEEHLKIAAKEYQKSWAAAVQFFQVEINKDRKKSGEKPLPFMAVRSKLAAVKEIDDLRWFYRQCLGYRNKKKGNTFSKCFFGALKVK